MESIQEKRIREKQEYDNYVNTPGKLGLSKFRPKLNFNINFGLSGFNIKYLIDKEWYSIDFDVFLPSKNMNLQRGFVWTLLQKQELIISILKGVKIPPLSVIQYKENGSITKESVILKIIDGKQRLSTLISYYKNEFSIEFEGKEYYFNDLTKQCQREIDDCLTVNVGYEYKDTPIPDEQKILWFEMINFAGTPQDKEHLENLKK